MSEIRSGQVNEASPMKDMEWDKKLTEKELQCATGKASNNSKPKKKTANKNTR
jgi:hypothetical protein